MGETLYVFLHEEKGGGGKGPAITGDAAVSRPDVRCYLSELYGHFWDICCLHKNLQLDVRIFTEDVAGGRGGSMERDTALLQKDLQVREEQPQARGRGKEEIPSHRTCAVRIRFFSHTLSMMQVVFCRKAQEVSESVNQRRAGKVRQIPHHPDLCLSMPSASKPPHILRTHARLMPHWYPAAASATIILTHMPRVGAGPSSPGVREPGRGLGRGQHPLPLPRRRPGGHPALQPGKSLVRPLETCHEIIKAASLLARSRETGALHMHSR